MTKRRRNRKGTSRHHIVFRSRYLNGVSGRVLSDNVIRLRNEHHDMIHYLDSKVDPKLVKKDEFYYVDMIRCAYEFVKEKLEI